ncbi:hypothetical protein IPH19_03035 [Candidatus Uhrbacteria bacterium]|nr:MAG: hypothetical protein IPH19_03035 [Candidatus Uhrbacteria bacterium]
MSSRNRQQEVLEHLAGYYQIALRDPKLDYMCISFWLAKPLGNIQLPAEGLLIVAIKGEEKRILEPERLDTHILPKRPDVCVSRLGMRLKRDALPEDWIDNCEISFGRSLRTFPFRGPSDISASLRPESVRPPPAPLQEAASP